MWDTTCVDAFAPSYRSLSVHAAGAVAAKAEAVKEEKYSDLLHTYNFVPITVESSGAFGPRSLAFVKDLGRKVWFQTGEEKAATYLISACLWLYNGRMQFPSWEAWADFLLYLPTYLFIHNETLFFSVC